MELTISILGFIVSFATFLFSVLVTYRGEQREKKTSNTRCAKYSSRAGV